MLEHSILLAYVIVSELTNPLPNPLLETCGSLAGGLCLQPATPRQKKLFTLLDLCVSSLRRGHANLLCIVPILTDDPRRESEEDVSAKNGWVGLGGAEGFGRHGAQNGNGG